MLATRSRHIAALVAALMIFSVDMTSAESPAALSARLSTADEAARLGGPDLTPVGAERNGNRRKKRARRGSARSRVAERRAGHHAP